MIVRKPTERSKRKETKAEKRERERKGCPSSDGAQKKRKPLASKSRKPVKASSALIKSQKEAANGLKTRDPVTERRPHKVSGEKRTNCRKGEKAAKSEAGKKSSISQRIKKVIEAVVGRPPGSRMGRRSQGKMKEEPKSALKKSPKGKNSKREREQPSPSKDLSPCRSPLSRAKSPPKSSPNGTITRRRVMSGSYTPVSSSSSHSIPSKPTPIESAVTPISSLKKEAKPKGRPKSSKNKVTEKEVEFKSIYRTRRNSSAIVDKDYVDCKLTPKTKKSSRSIAAKEELDQKRGNKAKSPKKGSRKRKKRSSDREEEDDEQDKEVRSEALNGKRRKKPRVASLNAMCKVSLLYECERDKERVFGGSSESESSQDGKGQEPVLKKPGRGRGRPASKDENQVKPKPKSTAKSSKSVPENKCRKIVLRNTDTKLVKATPRKRKLDDGVEIIDTRRCKRMASLNASAILAASYSTEKSSRRSKSIDSTDSETSVELFHETQISSSVSRVEITPTTSIHVCEANRVVVAEQKHETIEMFKQVRSVSGKIRDRLLAIEMMEREKGQMVEPVNGSKSLTSGKSKGSRSKGCRIEKHALTSTQVTGLTTTKVHVTKVQINTTQGSKDHREKKGEHKIQRILEKKDAYVRRQYQYQTKATSQSYCLQSLHVQTSAVNPSPVTVSLTPGTLGLPRPSPPTLGQMHGMSATATPLMPPMLGANQPTYYSYPGLGPGQPSVLQVACHQPSYRALSTPSVTTVNSLSLPVPVPVPVPVVNVTPYASHYGSAFTVPHYATHSSPPSIAFPATSYGFYQPAGPLIQPVPEACLIHKPIPFHPTLYQGSFANVMEQNPVSTNTNNFQSTLSPTVSPNAGHYLLHCSKNRVSVQPHTVYYQSPSPATITQPVSVAASRGDPMGLSRNSTTGMPSLSLNRHQRESHSAATPEAYAFTSLRSQPITHSCKSVQCSTVGDEQVNQLVSRVVQPQHTSVKPAYDDSQRVQLMAQQIQPQPQLQLKVPTVATVRPQVSKKSVAKEDVSRKRNIALNSIKQQNPTVQLDKGTDFSAGRLGVGVTTGASKESQPPQLLDDQVKRKTGSVTGGERIDSASLNKLVKTSSVQVSSSPFPVTCLSPSSRMFQLKRTGRKRFAHGWSWVGKASKRYVFVNAEEPPQIRSCFLAMKHIEGDVIRIRDCVLLRSGPRKTDLPFVAKISALWETAEGEMMMGLLWYYRPEHTDIGRKPNQMVDEIFASKHRDVNSVACIDDKCYVLTYNEYCRYRKRQNMATKGVKRPVLTEVIVPSSSSDGYPRKGRLPSPQTSPEMVFCCRKVYDFRQKRILKNPV